MITSEKIREDAYRLIEQEIDFSIEINQELEQETKENGYEGYAYRHTIKTLQQLKEKLEGVKNRQQREINNATLIKEIEAQAQAEADEAIARIELETFGWFNDSRYW